MAADTNPPDSWNKLCKISILVKGGAADADIAFGARTEDVDIDEGTRGGNSVASIDGSRIWLDTPQEDGTITFKMRPLNIVATTGTGLFNQFRGGTADTTDPYITDDDHVTGTAAATTLIRNRYRIAILCTNDMANTGSHQATAVGSSGLRFVAVECRLVSEPFSFANKDGVVTATFKFPCRTVTNVWNYDWESSDGTTGLPDLAGYA